ncbi:ABC-type nitrate/sulfonate/bicarbonate transport system, ATPase component [Herbaspirillum sp. CF444]|uniref:ABC transporter ATP-binding protein n=1 Tax=Herbaspirillum sp. CF444 TaxID=1144319 RepID=UPI000272333C|nr:ABC transporter ATP-binding protein [Herbaspirillum sp. CF444]EJL94397.1 ABC-type nitrate/sulfonate/bicarbonate transport system, ATPase component [Herbaspirillum sp. CF444]
MLENRLEVQNLSHAFIKANGEEIRIFQNLNFSVGKAEIVAIVGRSGAGKSTLFNLISGLLTPSAGKIALGEKADGTPGSIAYMLQKDLLLPWRTILENAVLGIELHRPVTDADRTRARAMLGRYGLESVANAYPHSLSGGMKQRVALTRTLLADPSVVLLDEPFSALDYETRLMLENDVISLTRSEGTSVILVTHDIDEAIAMSNRIVVLGGRPVQITREEKILLTVDGVTDGDRDAVMARGAPEFPLFHKEIWNALRASDVAHAAI